MTLSPEKILKGQIWIAKIQVYFFSIWFSFIAMGLAQESETDLFRSPYGSVVLLAIFIVILFISSTLRKVEEWRELQTRTLFLSAVSALITLMLFAEKQTNGRMPGRQFIAYAIVLTIMLYYGKRITGPFSGYLRHKMATPVIAIASFALLQILSFYLLGTGFVSLLPGNWR
jgi:hypothetical protein